MKCQNCGQNEANYHYHSSVNGQVTEQHLCSSCAAEMEKAAINGEMKESKNYEQFGLFMPFNMFNSDDSWENITENYFGDHKLFPQIVVINPSMGGKRVTPRPVSQHHMPPKKAIPADAGEEIKRKMEINKLRCEMENAIMAENFEEAASIRDKIYRLEKKNA